MRNRRRSIWPLILIVLTIVSLAACGGGGGYGGDGDGTATGATLTGNVATFTASLEMEKKTMLAMVKDFFVPDAFAQASGVTVSVGSLSTTTDANGDFTIYNIPTGDITITFTQDAVSVTYSLKGVEANETFTLNDVQVSSGQVATEHTGTWVGTATSLRSDGTVEGTGELTVTIAAGGNSLSATVDNGNEIIEFTGTEDGTSVSGTFETVTGECAGEAGTISGTFSGSTLSGTWQETNTVSGCVLTHGTFELTQT